MFTHGWFFHSPHALSIACGVSEDIESLPSLLSWSPEAHAGHGILWQYPQVHLKWLENFTCENCKIQGAIGLNFQIFRRLISSAPRVAHSYEPVQPSQPSTYTPKSSKSLCGDMGTGEIMAWKSMARKLHDIGTKARQLMQYCHAFWNCIIWLSCAVCNKNGTADQLTFLLASHCSKLKLCSHHTGAKGEDGRWHDKHPLVVRCHGQFTIHGDKVQWRLLSLWEHDL